VAEAATVLQWLSVPSGERAGAIVAAIIHVTKACLPDFGWWGIGAKF
jgi:hypothetical protein